MSECTCPVYVSRRGEVDFDPTHRIWCPCFLAWQPALEDTTTCPAYGCTPALLLVREDCDPAGDTPVAQRLQILKALTS